MKHWFLPSTPDVMGLLRSQGKITQRGMGAFVAWSAGDAASEAAVRDAEHEADGVRRELQGALRAAFSTPLDAEDIYELSERLDAVLNAAKNAVREAQVMGITPDATLASMATDAAAGVDHLCDAFALLTTDQAQATVAADRAISCERRVEHTYRTAMSQLLQVADLRQVIAWREMYRRYARLGEGLVRVAERVWYAVVKEG